MGFSNIQFTLTIIASIIAVITLILGVLEYRKKNMLTRIDIYLKMRDYYARDENLQKVCSALGEGRGSINVKELTYEQKRQFLGTMESIALLVNSKVMNKQVAMYMFGYYAIAAWENEEFWSHGNLRQDDPMWSLYKAFYLQNCTIRNEFDMNPSFYIKRKLNFLSK
ncbi:hypothetical protein KORDIASMS9_03118 [Kordia sp. SMS9]|uniref:hypothetical protein n=1 Tax=Kordia sp. SMS9 TaxID=2282170 RepID=UPI000E0DE111|nr:hypothetical protein [Kordia sp. SMS9]AXG70868.1 hypothetical protein KORDIASMS9_03118 [Kordia sp. SMS9]